MMTSDMNFAHLFNMDVPLTRSSWLWTDRRPSRHAAAPRSTPATKRPTSRVLPSASVTQPPVTPIPSPASPVMTSSVCSWRRFHSSRTPGAQMWLTVNARPLSTIDGLSGELATIFWRQISVR